MNRTLCLVPGLGAASALRARSAWLVSLPLVPLPVLLRRDRAATARIRG
jgi:hypothetical protein